MKQYLKLSLLLSFILCSQIITGQQLTKEGYNQYSHIDKLYSYEELRPILLSNGTAVEKYDLAMRAKKRSRIFLGLTLSAVAVSTLAPIIDPKDQDMYCDLFCPSTGQVIGFLGWVAVVPAFGVTAIGTRMSFNTKKYESIQLFNEGIADQGLLEELNRETEWQLSVAPTNNGAGLRIDF